MLELPANAEPPAGVIGVTCEPNAGRPHAESTDRYTCYAATELYVYTDRTTMIQPYSMQDGCVNM